MNNPKQALQKQPETIKEPNMTLQSAQNKVSEMEAPRVSEDFMKKEISSVQYQVMGHSTICMMEIKNGFRVFGTSTPASPENYNAEVGQRYAYENAFRQLWPFFGWRLRDALTGGVDAIRSPALQEGEPGPRAQKSWHGSK